MRTVTRGPEPQVLVENGEAWTAELLAEIERCAATGEKVEDKFFDKYRKDEVRNELKRMYRGFCCYCEARISIVSYPHIEHRKPKRPIPSETFTWHNLHLACEKCNKAKGDRWSDTDPILDSCVDPIEQHLTYRESPTGLLRWPENNSRRGDTTITHTRLNRDGQDGLPGRRLMLFAETLGMIRDIKKTDQANPGSATVHAMVAELQLKVTGEYGTVFAWTMAEYLDDELAAVGG